ncbi:hypothetical protein U1Q18_051440 [Sarracenia purpurea var. burkii]
MHDASAGSGLRSGCADRQLVGSCEELRRPTVTTLTKNQFMKRAWLSWLRPETLSSLSQSSSSPAPSQRPLHLFTKIFTVLKAPTLCRSGPPGHCSPSISSQRGKPAPKISLNLSHLHLRLFLSEHLAHSSISAQAALNDSFETTKTRSFPRLEEVLKSRLQLKTPRHRACKLLLED